MFVFDTSGVLPVQRKLNAGNAELYGVEVELQAIRFGRIFFKAPSVPTSGTVRVYFNDERIPSDINHLVVEQHQARPVLARIFRLHLIEELAKTR